MSSTPAILGLVLFGTTAGLALMGVLWHWVASNPRGDMNSGGVWRLAQLYTRIVHALRVSGRTNIPTEHEPGPLIVVANHTAGIDPILVQAACPFHIRWMMAADMRAPALEWFWQWWEVIFVDRERPQGAGVRQALRHLRDGGVIGIFPEGGLERPPREIMTFRPGVGVLIKHTRARVLPVLIEDTPQVDPAWASLWRPSRSKVTFLPLVDFSETGLSGEEITTHLRDLLVDVSGWPANNDPPPWEAEQDASPYGERIDSRGNRSPYGSSVPHRRVPPARPTQQPDAPKITGAVPPADPESPRAAGDGSIGRARSA